MARTLYLSYSGYNQFRECPRQYYFNRVKKYPPSTPDSKHNALLGTVIQAVFEKYFNERMWEALPLSIVEEELQDFGRLRFFQFLDEETINWKSPSCKVTPASLQEELSLYIPQVLAYLHEAGLHGPITVSEVDFKQPLEDGLTLVGFVDFIIQLPDGSTLILDGKSTKHKSRVDPKQLRFYALLFFLKYHKLPDRMGFLYYRYCGTEGRDRPQNQDPLEQGPIEWTPVVLDELLALRQDLLLAADQIRELDFTGVPPASPTPSLCQYCSWEPRCPERLAQKKANSDKRSKKAQEGLVPFPDLFQVLGVGKDSEPETFGFSEPVTAKGRMAREQDKAAPRSGGEGEPVNPFDFLPSDSE